MTTTDIIVIGSGPGGYSTAAKASASGSKVIIIERDELGGTCLNRGCIPTKALCRSAEVASVVKEASEFGVNIQEFSVNYPQAVSRKNEVVTGLREGVQTLLSGVEIVKGDAVFTDPHTVKVGEESYTAEKIIIATGSKPAMLPIPGSEYAVTSDFILEMTELPESLIVIGGGVIGMEFASIFNAFGVKVTVLEYCAEILPPFDEEVAKRLRMSLKRRGIEIVTSAQVTAISPDLAVECSVKGKAKTFQAQMVLMAVGRTPVLPVGLKEAGIELTPRGAVKVNNRMETNIPGVFAIGDVNGLCMLAHAAEAQGDVVLEKPIRLDIIPSAVFTMPECAMVGVTEKQCAEKGIEFKIGKATFRSNGKAMAMGEPDGMVKVILSPDDRLLGCHICGAHAADLVQEAATLMNSDMPATALSDAIHSHPTLGETVKTAVEAAISIK
ncbi:MAG: dihydrolipoyl dehydrogenase [Paramuribaculum sp.]|nr:dihydrolipoyl dehydrogenase [Paramuribaculum sp.]